MKVVAAVGVNVVGIPVVIIAGRVSYALSFVVSDDTMEVIQRARERTITKVQDSVNNFIDAVHGLIAWDQEDDVVSLEFDKMEVPLSLTSPQGVGKKIVYNNQSFESQSGNLSVDEKGSENSLKIPHSSVIISDSEAVQNGENDERTHKKKVSFRTYSLESSNKSLEI